MRPHRALTSVSAVALLLALPTSGIGQQRWFETAQLLPPVGSPDQESGWSVALSGNTALVGAPGSEGPIGGSFGAGAAHVYVLQGTSWTRETTLPTPAMFNAARFGEAVALDGDTAVVGLPELMTGGFPRQGGVAVFVRSGVDWMLEELLLSPDPQLEVQRFGHAVAVSGDTLAVGAPGADESFIAGAGAVYVFVRSAGDWSLEQRIVAPSPEVGADFGWDLDLDGDTLLVGEPRSDSQPGKTDAGAGRVFTRTGTTWSLEASLLSLDIAARDEAGTAVALSGNHAVVGAPGLFGPGELTTFRKGANGWVQHTYIIDLTINGQGRALSMDGTTLVTGTTAGVAAGQRPGAVPYVLESGTWTWAPPLWGRDGNTGAEDFYFTPSLALDGDLMLVGVSRHDGAAEDGGIVHVFTRDGPWTDLGHALKGSSLTPTLYAAGSFASPSDDEFLVAGVPGGGQAWLILSTTNLSAPFKGGVLVPAPDIAVGPVPVPTATSETTNLRFALPAGIPSGATLYAQHWYPDAGGPFGFAAGNGLSATIP